MSDLPKFEPLPNVGNVVSNRVTAFNQGYNLYQCINYLQGYVSIVYENMDALLDDWNNFQKVVVENIPTIATEETQRILNEWLEDGTLNDLIAKNPLWDQKLDKTGGTMTGNIKFSENTKIVGTTPGGNDIDLIHNTNDGASGNYVQFGDPDAKTVINSSQQPVWHNGDDDYLLLTQAQLDEGLSGKVNKSGDTMTGNLNVPSLSRDGKDVITGDSTSTSIGDASIQTTIVSSRKPNFLYAGGIKQPLVENDIVDNLTSNSSWQPLSAKQGKVLNNKINELAKVETEMIAVQKTTGSSGFSISSVDDYRFFILSIGEGNEYRSVATTILDPKTNANRFDGTKNQVAFQESGYNGSVAFNSKTSGTLEKTGQYGYVQLIGVKV